MSGELIEALVRVLGETLEREGGGPGSSIHSWRCEYPDRYGPCDCVMGVAREQAEALAPVVAEHVAGERGAALRSAADAIDADDEVALNRILGGASYTMHWLRDRADREASGGGHG